MMFMVRTHYASLQWLSKPCDPEVVGCLQKLQCYILKLQLVCFVPYSVDWGRTSWEGD